MSDARSLLNALSREGCHFYTGVPDSVLGGFSTACSELDPPARHLIAANEGNAIGLAAGWWYSRRSVPVVYMQNSGLGNALNPLVSLAHRDLYGIPSVLLIGWRGNPDAEDEPQHRVQGRITEQLLGLLDVKVTKLASFDALQDLVGEVVRDALSGHKPVAVLIPNGVISKGNSDPTGRATALNRGDAVRVLCERIGVKDAVVGSTGYISRDLYGQFEVLGRNRNSLFMSVGSMGHASQIALGIALGNPKRRVWCVDGDGALLMHLGGAATVGNCAPNNFVHVILDNGVHASVGGAATCAPRVEFSELASVLGYASVARVSTYSELDAAAQAVMERDGGCTLIHVLINTSEVRPLGRPTESLHNLGVGFESFLAA